MGYKYQFITLAGIHNMWYGMFDLAQEYVKSGMTAYVEKVQEPEFAARDRGYTFVSHQQEVGTGYFDDVTHVIQERSFLDHRHARLDRRRAVRHGRRAPLTTPLAPSPAWRERVGVRVRPRQRFSPTPGRAGLPGRPVSGASRS